MSSYPDFYWLNEESKQFLQRGYLLEGKTAEARIREIAEHAERILGIEGYADKFYNYMTKGYYSLSTPVWSNFGAGRSLPISCFGSVVPDSVAGIMETATEIAMMGKEGGGTSAYFGKVRPRGSVITNNGKSDGSFTFLKIYESVIEVISQGTSRRSQLASYIDIDHGDIEEWLDIHTEGNPIQLSYYGVCIDDDWMRSMIEGDKYKRQIWAKVLQRRSETGIPYLFFKDNVNNNKPDVYKDKNLTIHASNMCVSSDTKILTKEKGHVEIGSVVGEKLTVWNGEEWSENVEMVKTGENQQLVRVVLSDGRFIECTPYHKWYIQKGYPKNPGSEVVMVRTHELKKGDKLEKFTLPLIEGTEVLENAYTNGFYTADGTKSGNMDIVYLYDEKQALEEYITGNIQSRYLSKLSNRVELRMKGLKDKYFVPDHTYTIQSRLDWLAGLLDGDGTISYNGDNQSLQLCSIHKEFLLEVSNMLQTLGICSRINNSREAGLFSLPLNDGSGNNGFYYCKPAYRLLIGSVDSQKLLKLGLNLKRLNLVEHTPNRSSTHYVTIRDIIVLDGLHDTYCCTEPKRNKVIFNGVMTGNCNEIYLPSSEEESFVCCLASMNLLHFDSWKLTDAVETLTYFLEAIMTEFIRLAKLIPHLERAVRFAERHRALGLGVLGWHSYLQSNMIPFESFQAMQKNAEIFRLIKERTYKASAEMAERYGEPELLKGYGRRHTTTMAIAPTKSSSFILGAVSPSIEPFKSNYYVKDLSKIKTVYKNPFLEKLLEEKGFNTEEIWQSILINDGSVQHLDILTDDEKNVFKTFSEISQMTVIQQAAQRQAFIDQGQSINVMIHPDTPTKDVNQLYITAWELGLKGLYYQFSISAAQRFNRDLLTACASCEA